MNAFRPPCLTLWGSWVGSFGGLARRLPAGELATVSRRIAALWLQGQHKAPEVQQLVPRLLGLRQRVQNYTNAQRASGQVDIVYVMMSALCCQSPTF